MDLITPLLMVASIFFSSSCVTANKYLATTYDFHFMTSLTTLHFLFTYLYLDLLVHTNLIKKAQSYPPINKWRLGFFGVSAVALMNFNLKMNSVGFYQLSKLCCIPVLVIFNKISKNIDTPFKTLVSLLILMIGVYIFSINDVHMNLPGTIVAIIAVLFTAVFQSLGAAEQKEFQISGNQIQHASALPQFIFGFIFSLCFELKGILHHNFQSMEIAFIFLTAFLAIGVNVTFFMLIGRTSALTYQVVGHVKTTLVFASGFVFFPEAHAHDYSKLFKEIFGIIVSMTGMILYSHFQLSLAKPKPEEERPLEASKPSSQHELELPQHLNNIFDKYNEEEENV